MLTELMELTSCYFGGSVHPSCAVVFHNAVVLFSNTTVTVRDRNGETQGIIANDRATVATLFPLIRKVTGLR